ncbi:MAG: glycosyltransferase family 39 protein [Alphaproteobacteria bacterium]|nr:glycosyltransferase family 39 protein [Alphaproteobacteria bacterium]
MFIVSIVVFFFLNNHSLLCLDEMATMLKMQMSFRDMMTLLYVEDVHLPAYFILLKVWLSVFGTSVFVARCFSYIGLLACAFGGGFMVKKLYGEKAGIWFAALFLFMPVSFWFARTIRMYSWACFFCTMAFLFAQAALLKGEKKDFILYVVFAFLGAWTHYYSSLTCALIAVAYLVLSFQKDKTLFKKFFLADTVLFLIVCPQIYIFLHQNTGAIKWPNDEYTLNAYRTYFSDFSLPPAIEKVVFFMMSGFWVVCAQFLIKNKSETKQVAITGLAIALGVYYIAFVASFLYRPFLTDRYLTVALGGLFLSFALCIASDKRNEIVFGILLPVTFFIIVMTCRGVVSQSIQPDFIEAVRKNVTANDVIITNDWRSRFLLYYFFPEYDIRTSTFRDIIFKAKLKMIDKKEMLDLIRKKNVFFAGMMEYPCQEKKNIFVRQWDEYMGIPFGLTKAIKCDEETVP